MTARRVLAGIALVVGSGACFAVLDTTAKGVVAWVPVLMAVWFRYMFQAVATSVVVVPMRGRRTWRTQHLPFQVLRGLLLLTASILSVFSLRHIPVGEFTAILMIAPLLVTLLASTLLKEHVSFVRWLLVAGAFTGTLLIIRPGGAGFSWIFLVPLLLAFLNAGFQILTGRMARTEDPLTTHFYTGWVGALLSSLMVPFVWTAVDSVSVWLALCLMGLMGSLGHLMLVQAYQHAPAATLSPYLYSQIVFAMLGGLLVFGHAPDAIAIAGMALIGACGVAGVWISMRERRVAVQVARA